MGKPVMIVASGMVSSVGHSAAASCAAMRAAISGFVETRFIDQGGQWILGAPISFEVPLSGIEKLGQAAALAIDQSLNAATKEQSESIPLLLCVAEGGRPGRMTGLDFDLLPLIYEILGIRFHAESRVLPQGRMSGMTAIQLARSAIYDGGFPFCLVAGVDSFLVAETLTHYEGCRRLLTSENSDGFIPGEAAAAVLLGMPRASSKTVSILGLGSGSEPASLDSDNPLRAEGLVVALRTALSDAGVGWDQIDFRITDLNGEKYFFREATLALTRSLRARKIEFDIWHTADCIGEVGAATIPSALVVAADAAEKGYAPGPGIVCHFSSEGLERAALVLRAE